MTRTRMIGFGLWALCAALTAAAVGFGWAATNDLFGKAMGVSMTLGFALAAEAAFWSGGAVLGLSFFAKRGGWMKRLFKRAKTESAQ